MALLKQAGAVVIGKTNTPEFGAGSQTFNPVFGPTRNPCDPRLTPGGSSGGAAAAVAARMIPFADGSDLAASVRNPAAFCGLVGLRTTPGLVPADVLEPLAVAAPATSWTCGPRRCAGCGWRGPMTWATCRCSRRSWPCSARAAPRWRTPGAR